MTKPGNLFVSVTISTEDFSDFVCSSAEERVFEQFGLRLYFESLRPGISTKQRPHRFRFALRVEQSMLLRFAVLQNF